MGHRRIQLEKLSKEFPDDPELQYGLAMDSFSDGLWSQGIEELLVIISNYPSFIPSYLQLGQAFVREGMDDKAIGIYRNGIKIAKEAGDVQSADEMTRFLEQIL